jgi:hypothetical protein
MRLWLGIGIRRISALIIVQPFTWRWSLANTPTLVRELYLGPVTLQFWRR